MQIGLLEDDEPDEGEASALDHGTEPRQWIPKHETTIELGESIRAGRPKAEQVEPSERLIFLREIARGGMGIVHRVHDTVLGRDLALKVLRERHRDRPEMIDRFVEEARIAGQLQHPGIVPIHELGSLADDRPFFTMKLVKGRTLAEILAERNDPATARPHLLAIFLQIAQTMAYAHDRSVIHRDLKPSNVMVGKYGEVQVMDWGLAKVLPRDGGGAGDSERESAGELPDASFMGTPGYMAPEQFGRGSVHADRRTDVFALGAILYELLCGRPLRDDRSFAEIRDGDVLRELAAALEVLETCDADQELIGLARECLSADPVGRPADAGVLAAKLSEHLESVQDRLRRAELERVRGQARAAEEKKRRRLIVLVTLLIAAMGALIGVNYAAWLKRSQARDAAAALVLRDVEVFRDAAVSDPAGEISRWQAASAAAVHARQLLSDAPDSARRQMNDLELELERGSRRAQVDALLLERIEQAYARTDEGAYLEADELLERAFLGAGLAVDTDSPVAVGKAVASRPEKVAHALAVALDCWAIVRREREANLWEPDVKPWQRPLAAARAAHPDRWRESLRDALATRDHEAIARLAEADDLEKQPVSALWLLGRLLLWDHQTERASGCLPAPGAPIPTTTGSTSTFRCS